MERMSPLRWGLMTALVALTASLVAERPARAQTAPLYAWVQFESDGLPHARAIVATAPCPALTVGPQAIPMVLRVGPGGGFADAVCDAPLPAAASDAHVGSIGLPVVPRAPHRIAFFGDTGCRLKGAEVQACNDPLKWPLPTVARDVARERPDLIVHVGDYYYRESPCPGTVDCTNSPHGDNSDSWYADYFAPMVPAFAAAPIVNTRGNHETCDRSPLGWARYLSGLPAATCIAHEPADFVAFDNLVIADVDDATEVTEQLAAPPVFGADEQAVNARAASDARETWLVAHRPPMAYLAAHASDDPNGSHIAAIVSGHLHTFGAYSFAGATPQVIVGIGGDNLDFTSEKVLRSLFPNGTTEARFGYAMFEWKAGGWDIVVHDIDGRAHRRCRLAARAVRGGPALTGATP